MTTVALVDVSERKRRGEPVVGAGVGLPGAGNGGTRGAATTGMREVSGVNSGDSGSGSRTGVGLDGSGSRGPRGAAGGTEAVTAGVSSLTTEETAPEALPETSSDVLPEVLSGYLTEQTVKVPLDAVDKGAAIREVAGLLARTGKVVDVEELVATALRREELGTTGLGEEIAIPHAKTDAVSAPVVGFARSVEGVEWGSPDGTKARLVFMIAVPEAPADDEHLRILALLSRKSTDAGFRKRLLAAGDEGAVLGVLSEVG
ncbi:PTS system, fructose-specific IIC component [Streptomyces sp. 3213]|nr:PTS system, fructose-specific IIC component [Streptomyces sp. 3213] [Streptomyces sp. 3213.3]